jgi:hypothetical protein
MRITLLSRRNFDHGQLELMLDCLTTVNLFSTDLDQYRCMHHVIPDGHICRKRISTDKLAFASGYFLSGRFLDVTIECQAVTKDACTSAPSFRSYEHNHVGLLHNPSSATSSSYHISNGGSIIRVLLQCLLLPND